MRTRRPVVMAEYMGEEPTAPTVSRSEATAEEFQTRVVEAETLAEELDSREDGQAVLHRTADILENLQRIVEEVAADDDVAESTIDIMREVANRELARSGQRLADLPTLESWHTPKERLMLSTESISETLKKVWEAIKDAAERVYEALLKFMMGFIGVVESALRLAQELQKDLPGMNWASAEPVKTAQAKYIAVNNKLTPQWPTDVLSTLTAVAEADKDMFNVTQDIAAQYLTEFNQANDAKKIEATWDKQAERCIVLFRTLRMKLAAIVTTPPKKPLPGQNGTLRYSSGLLPGEYRIESLLPAENLQGSEFMIAFETAITRPGGVVREPFPQNSPKPEIAILPAVDKAVVKSAVDGLVDALTDVLKEQKDQQAAMKELNGKLGKMGDQMVAAAMDSNLSDGGKRLLAVHGKMATLPKTLSRPVNKYLLMLIPHYVSALRATVNAYS